MGKGKSIAAIAAAIILLAGIGWYVESPVYTLRGIRNAAQANDSDALSAYIDYPALRESVKSQIIARVQADVAKRDRSGLGSFEVALASAVIGPLTDAVVSPAGVRAMLLSKQREDAASAGAPHSPVQLGSDVRIDRRGLSEFDLRNKSKSGGALIFKRHGFGWKLSGVEMAPGV